MNYKLLLIGSLLFFLNSTVAQACPQQGNPKSLSYIRRDNNRCEGLQDRNAGSSSFDLISFSTSNLNSNLNSYPEALNIRVLGTGKTAPTIEVQSFFRNYRLDEVDARFTASGFIFILSTAILKRASIPLNTLRSLAYIAQESEIVYFPLILGKSSGRYEFIINSPQRNTFPTFEIRHNGKTVLSKPRNIPQKGHITLIWEYSKAPAGLYELYIVDGQGQRRSFRFKHDPKWL
jgi:hypothetical protein